MYTNKISKYNKQALVASVLLASFFLGVPYGKAQIECKNFYRDGRE